MAVASVSGFVLKFVIAPGSFFLFWLVMGRGIEMSLLLALGVWVGGVLLIQVLMVPLRLVLRASDPRV